MKRVFTWSAECYDTVFVFIPYTYYASATDYLASIWCYLLGIATSDIEPSFSLDTGIIHVPGLNQNQSPPFSHSDIDQITLQLTFGLLISCILEVQNIPLKFAPVSIQLPVGFCYSIIIHVASLSCIVLCICCKKYWCTLLVLEHFEFASISSIFFSPSTRFDSIMPHYCQCVVILYSIGMFTWLYIFMIVKLMYI